MNNSPAAVSQTSGPSPVVIAAVVDAVLILIFAAIGREAHERGNVVAGVFVTAWPFLVGALAGWLVFKVWRHPFALAGAGIPVWLGSVAIGMTLRFVTGQAVVAAFIIVALLALGIMLLGYRAVLAVLPRIFGSTPRN